MVWIIFLSQFSSAFAASWTVSGTNLSLEIQNERIVKVGPPTKRPGTFQVAGEIFPGAIDLHNHLEYNVFPRWKYAQGQFKNRHEWKYAFPEYKATLSFNRRAYRGSDPEDELRTKCAILRYAEWKAALGGVTTIQGISNKSDLDCVTDFGIRNIDSSEIDFGQTGLTPIMSINELVAPRAMGRIWLREIKPKLDAGKSYEAAFQEWVEEVGIAQWKSSMADQLRLAPKDRSLEELTKLLVPKNLGSVEWGKDKPAKELLANHRSLLVKTFSVDPWVMRESKTVGRTTEAHAAYLVDALELLLVALKDQSPTADQAELGKILLDEGQLHFAREVTEYFGFHQNVWLRANRFLSGVGEKSMLAHFSEGSASDEYNADEFQVLKKLGLVKQGLHLVHATGLTIKDRKEHAGIGGATIWSPASNLLLYGDTTPIEDVLNSGAILALAPDWTVTGSRNSFEEIQYADSYLKKFKKVNFGEEMWLDLVTANPAKIIGRQDYIGSLKPGLRADFFVLAGNLVGAGAESVLLTVKDGLPIVGEESVVNELSKKLNLKFESYSMCGGKFRKSFVIPKTPSKFAPEMDRPSKIWNHLSEKVRSFKERNSTSSNLMELDPWVECRSTQVIVREFVDMIDENARTRGTRRRNGYSLPLTEKYLPFVD